jgi:antitoxin CptB
MAAMAANPELKRLAWRAHHRGIREADLLVGAFFDRHSAGWTEAEIAWFEELLEEQDVDILAWAMGTAEAPRQLAGEMMLRLQKLDYMNHPE